jgi:hypothetical protein
MTGRTVQGMRGWIDQAATAIMVIFAVLAAAIALTVALGPQGLSNPGPPVWAVFAVVLLAAAYGQWRGARWASALTFILGIVTIVIAGLLALFAVLLTGGDLSGTVLALPVVGPLNGWLSLAAFGLVIGAGVLMVASAMKAGGGARTG